MNSNISFIEWQKKQHRYLVNTLKPKNKNEEWRYSNFHFLEQKDQRPTNLTNQMELILNNDIINNQKLPTGVSIFNCKDQNFMTYLNHFVQQDNFDKQYQVLQNYAFSTQGFIIRFSRSHDKPIKLTLKSSGTNYILLLIQIDPDVNIQIIEHFIDTKHSNTNFVSKIKIGQNAQVKHAKIHNAYKETTLIYSSHIEIEQYSHYQKYSSNLIYHLYKEYIQCHLQGTHAHADLIGINYSHNTDHIDIVLLVKHMADNTKSYQRYTHVLNDNVTSSFYGRVIIPYGLHKIEAHQLNKNVLLSPNVKAFSRPELHINSNDVKCSHGATISDIDPNTLYYMQSRGLNILQARNMYIVSCLNTMLSKFDCHHELTRLLKDDIKNQIIMYNKS